MFDWARTSMERGRAASSVIESADDDAGQNKLKK